MLVGLPRQVAAHPMIVELEPDEERCFFAELDAQESVMEVFVERGGKLNIWVTLTGPYDIGDARRSGLPSETDATQKLFEENVQPTATNEDLSDNFRLPFTPEGTAIFRACLNNKNSRFVRKVVQFDLRHVDDTPMNEKDPLKKKGEKKFGKGKKGKGGAEADEAKEDAMDGHGKKEDLDKVQNSINNLRKLSQDVHESQRLDRNRLSVHSSMNDDTHNEMVVGSLVETSIFIGVACFQIFFVRRWFEGRGTGTGAQAKSWA